MHSNMYIFIWKENQQSAVTDNPRAVGDQGLFAVRTEPASFKAFFYGQRLEQLPVSAHRQLRGQSRLCLSYSI